MTAVSEGFSDYTGELTGYEDSHRGSRVVVRLSIFRSATRNSAHLPFLRQSLMKASISSSGISAGMSIERPPRSWTLPVRVKEKLTRFKVILRLYAGADGVNIVFLSKGYDLCRLSLTVFERLHRLLDRPDAVGHEDKEY